MGGKIKRDGKSSTSPIDGKKARREIERELIEGHSIFYLIVPTTEINAAILINKSKLNYISNLWPFVC